jgi:hypothetical protein
MSGTGWLALHDEIVTELGGYTQTHWDEIENTIWLSIQNDRARDRERYLFDGTRRFESLHRAREWKENAKHEVVAVRCCKICKRMWAITAWAQAYRRNTACSPECRRLVSWKAGVHRVDGIADTVTGHARRFGICPESVRFRMKSGWTIEKALKTPPTPRGERRWNKAS